MATNIDPSFIEVDASIILAELLPDEQNFPKVEEYFNDFSEKKVNFIAPTILKYEVANALKNISSERKLTLQNKKDLLKEFLSWPIVYKDVNFYDIFKLATLENLTVYDASYLYLSKINNCKLLTLDKKLASL